MKRIVLSLLMLSSLSACDVLKDRMGIKDPAKVEAEAKAVGASCRLSGRSLEDCYNLNESYPRAPIYSGWKEMNEYMAERKMEAQPPSLGPDGKPLDRKASEPADKKEPAKEEGKNGGKEPAKDGAKTESGGKDAIKDIRPKKPDLAKEAAKH
ncbi:MAG: hypothetical protein HY850_00380 [Betaproteobacteria bacterium]|nr:hypothetical protein [Betaproteobacteria bacterium]